MERLLEKYFMVSFSIVESILGLARLLEMLVDYNQVYSQSFSIFKYP